METIQKKQRSSIVEVDGLSRDFEGRVALSEVDFVVPTGCVMGLVGENGAGKTTLIKHLMGLYYAQQGTVRVFGKDPVKDPEGVLGKIGYLSENREMLDWMRLDELLDFTSSFYPSWDQKYALQLVNTFELRLDGKVQDFSRGQRAQAGLILAVAHHPDLLILDEPSSGLDPIVRRDILAEIIHTATQENRTVLFSSHLLDEVERVADKVTMISRGKVVLSQGMDELLQSHHALTIQFREPMKQFPTIKGVLSASGKGIHWVAYSNGLSELTIKEIQNLGGTILTDEPLSLDEIFIARVGVNCKVKEE